MTQFVKLLCLLSLFTPIGLAAQTALPDCADITQIIAPDGIYDDANEKQIAKTGCLLTWLENGKLRKITWQFYNDDLTPQTLNYSAPAGYTLMSQSPPQLIDVDGDAHSDLISFTSNGAANGDYDIYFFEPDSQSYLRPVSLNGISLSRDKDGLLVVPAKNGARAYIRLYSVTQGLITPAFDVDAQDACILHAGQDVAVWQNDVSALPKPLQFDAELIDYNCNIYDQSTSRTTPLAQDEAIHFLPANTVFYCQIGKNAATVTTHAGTYTYSYGPLKKAPDLTLTGRAVDVAQVAPSDGLTLQFSNGDYRYIAHNDGQNLRLTVQQGQSSAPIFDKLCDPMNSAALSLD